MIYLITRNKNSISDLSLKRHLGVSHTAAWRVKHKLLGAMRQCESRGLLHGVVFADDALLGGVQSSKPGRGSDNKAPFVAPVSLDGASHQRYVRFDAIDDCTGETLAAWPTPTGNYWPSRPLSTSRQRRTGSPCYFSETY